MDLFYQNSNTTLNIILKSQYLWLLITAIFSFPSHALDSHYVELESRKNITVPTLVLKPNNIDAAVILFAGGKGKIKILPSKYILKENNFLIRSRDLFAEQNLLVTILDIPSDRQEDGLLYNFRESKEHMQDISAAIDHIKTITNKPIWLVGTSRGSSSAIAGAIEIPDLISGIIISAPMTDENARGLDVPSMALRKVNLPVYIAHHKKDPCDFTRPAGSKKIAKGLKNASKVELQLFEGGYELKNTRDCGGLSHHGFLGIEKNVINAMAKFIHSQSTP